MTDERIRIKEMIKCKRIVDREKGIAENIPLTEKVQMNDRPPHK